MVAPPPFDPARGEVEERLLLRPGWRLLIRWLLGSIPCLLLGAIGWGAVLEGASNAMAWVLAIAGTSIGLCALGFVLRCRLILTRDGFRVRRLWRGHLVRWSDVRAFEAADVGVGDGMTAGARWDPWEVHLGRTGMLGAFRRYSTREIPIFGRSQQEMLDTLNAWLTRYSDRSR